MNKQEENIKRVTNVVQEICMTMGLNVAHDYDGIPVHDLGEAADYLERIAKKLPVKAIGQHYMVKPDKPKPLPAELSQPDMWKRLEKVIEDDLQEAIQSYDLKVAEQLHITFKNIGSEIDEGIDDILLHLSEKRVEILAVVFKNISGVEHIEWDGNRITIETTTHLDDDIIRELRDDIIETYPDYYLERIMGEMEISPVNSNILMWRWVG